MTDLATTRTRLRELRQQMLNVITAGGSTEYVPLMALFESAVVDATRLAEAPVDRDADIARIAAALRQIEDEAYTPFFAPWGIRHNAPLLYDAGLRAAPVPDAPETAGIDGAALRTYVESMGNRWPQSSEGWNGFEQARDWVLALLAPAIEPASEEPE